MKRFSTLFTAGLFALCFAITAQAAPGGEDKAIAELNNTAKTVLTTQQWDAFGGQLTNALKSGHSGLQEAAMRHVIQYGENVNVRAAVYDVMRIYRDGDNQNMRRMALVALGHMDSGWAIQFLERSLAFEKSPVLQRTIRAVVADYYARQETPGLIGVMK